MVPGLGDITEIEDLDRGVVRRRSPTEASAQVRLILENTVHA